ncbi:MAG: DNA translocase FtsK [Chlamydiota bacterium]
MAKTQSSQSEKKFSLPKEAQGLIFLGLSIIAFLSLLSFKIETSNSNWLGLVGYGIGSALTFLFGIMAYAVIGFTSWMGWQLLCYRQIPNRIFKITFFTIFLISLSMLLNLLAEHGPPLPEFLQNRIYSATTLLSYPYPHKYVRTNLGGIPLYYLYRDLPSFNIQRMLSDVGIGLTFSITAFVSFILLMEIQVLPYIKRLPHLVKQLFKKKEVQEIDDEPKMQTANEIENTLTKRLNRPIYTPVKEPESPSFAKKEEEDPTPAAKEKKSKLFGFSKRDAAINAAKTQTGDFSSYVLPPPSLLTSAKKVDTPSLKKELRRQAEILEETLLSFGIEAKVGEIHSGPTITSFEVHPAVGVKVQKIKALENDIALNLQAKSIRIIAPIPGKAAVGVEVPSPYPQEVSFKEMLTNYQQGGRKLHIPTLLGKTVSGEGVVSDLTKMPHCIIAGATGSGKSVCINTVIMSILMNARPDEVKLMMIDPKKVELTPYTALPHMIAPVITEAHGAYAALNWLVKEMQFRYDILKQLGLRNITAFNNRNANKEFEALLSIAVPDKMSMIVAIIDEFADLMMVSSSDLETPIARIAQMARAVGIHLILATQRPSREVITGLIKANFPTRISFKVASRINSQIILDEVGAESLLGNGDMLFLPPGSSHLIRAQGAYIRDEDINKVIQFICDQAPTQYLIPSFDAMRKEDYGLSKDGDEGGRDALYEQAKSIVIDTNTASTTFLQRKLKIGYARAASLMDELEASGIISAQEGSKPRRVIQSLSDKKAYSYEGQEQNTDE